MSKKIRVLVEYEIIIEVPDDADWSVVEDIVSKDCTQIGYQEANEIKPYCEDSEEIYYD